MARSVEIRDVFRDNFKEEEASLLLTLSQYKTIAFDTEFPGFLDGTPWDASDDHKYRDLKSNVERTKLIQLGLTVFDPATGFIAGVWQFNMAGFDPRVHEHAPDSIPFLETHGIDFAKNLSNGVRMWQLVDLLKKIRRSYGGEIQWVTFHGLYDMAYLIVSLTGNRKLPREIKEFARVSGEFFCGGIFDLKFMAGEEFKYMGLEKIAAAVGETRDQGRAHTAGSDSLLTAKVFVRAVRTMKECSGECYRRYKGFLYGISVPVLFVSGYYGYPPVYRATRTLPRRLAYGCYEAEVC